MKVYIVTTNLSDNNIENELLEGSSIGVNYGIEEGSTIFIYSSKASVPGIYALALMKTCQEVERGIYIGTAEVLRKDNYPFLDDVDLTEIGIKPNYITEVKDIATQESLFSLMDRYGDELLQKMISIEDLSSKLDVSPSTIINWYKYKETHKENEIMDKLPIYYYDYQTNKYYWNKNVVALFKEVQDELKQMMTSNLLVVSASNKNWGNYLINNAFIPRT